MYNNLYFLQKNLQTKLYIYKNHEQNIKFFHNITITVKLDENQNINKLNIFNNLIFYEFFLKKKVSINKLKYLNREWKIYLKISLNNFEVYDFLFFINLFIFPVFKRRNLKINKKITNLGGLNFSLKDLNNLPHLPNAFFNFNTKMNIYISFQQKKKKSNISVLILNGFKGIV